MTRRIPFKMNTSLVEEIADGTCADTGTDFFAVHEGFSLAGYTCRGAGWLVGGLLVIFAIQFGSNLLWTKIGQLQRVALSHPAHSHKRQEALRSMIKYMAVSSTVHIVSVLAIMSSNFFILLTIVLGNLTGAYFSFSTVHRDCDDTQQWKNFVGMLTPEHVRELKKLLDPPKSKFVRLNFGGPYYDRPK